MAAATLAFAAPCSFAASTQSTASGAITVRSTETLKGHDVTNWRVAATGRFTISGAVTERGTVTDYRNVTGSTILIRRVTVGRKGAITFLVSISQGSSAPAPWKITSATKAYKGLHGKGRQVVDNFSATPATFVLKGAVSQ